MKEIKMFLNFRNYSIAYHIFKTRCDNNLYTVEPLLRGHSDERPSPLETM